MPRRPAPADGAVDGVAGPRTERVADGAEDPVADVPEGDGAQQDLGGDAAPGATALPAGAAAPGAGAPAAPLTVAAVARRLGVAPATLRTWDRRYGLGPTAHSSGAHRRYSPADVARLEVVRRLVHEGVSPADAARTVLARDAGPEPPSGPAGPLAGRGRTGPAAGGEPAGPLPAGRPVEDDPLSLAAATLAATAGTPAGGGRVLPLPGGGPDVRGLARAAMALDAAAVTRAVAQAVQERGLVRAWDELLRPVLVAVGERWAVTGEGVEVEHLLSECTASALRAAASAAATPAAPAASASGRPVLLASTPGEAHSLPLHAVATGLAQHGVPVRLLGAALPQDALAAAVLRTGPAAVFLWAQFPRTADEGVLASFPRTRPAAALVVGGPGWSSAVLPPTVAYARGLQHALDVLLRAVAGHPVGTPSG